MLKRYAVLAAFGALAAVPAAAQEKFPARPVEFTEEALRTLERYRWPGNVRELQNVIERAAILAQNVRGEAYNAVTDGHPTRKAFYLQKAQDYERAIEPLEALASLSEREQPYRPVR